MNHTEYLAKIDTAVAAVDELINAGPPPASALRDLYLGEARIQLLRVRAVHTGVGSGQHRAVSQ